MAWADSPSIGEHHFIDAIPEVSRAVTVFSRRTSPATGDGSASFSQKVPKPPRLVDELRNHRRE
jgi:hypothetical protein